MFVHEPLLKRYVLKKSARTKEAALFVLKQILDELDSCSAEVNPDLARAFLEYIGLAMHDGEFFIVQMTSGSS